MTFNFLEENTFFGGMCDYWKITYVGPSTFPILSKLHAVLSGNSKQDLRDTSWSLQSKSWHGKIKVEKEEFKKSVDSLIFYSYVTFPNPFL